MAPFVRPAAADADQREPKIIEKAKSEYGEGGPTQFVPMVTVESKEQEKRADRNSSESESEHSFRFTF